MAKRRKKYRKNTKTKSVVGTIAMLVIIAVAVFAAYKIANKDKTQPVSSVKYYETDEGDLYVPTSKADPDRAVTVRIDDGGTAGDCGLEADEAELINTYFERYYTSLGRFVPEDVSDLFEEDAVYQRSLCTSMIYYLCGVRDIMSVDLGFDECDVGLKYLSASNTEDGCRKIELVVNDYMSYDYIPNKVSYTCDVEHTFILNGGKITEHSEISGAYSHLTEAYDAFAEDGDFDKDTFSEEQANSIFKAISDDMIDASMRDIKKAEGEKIRYNNDPSEYALKNTADHAYDADAALAYSYEWTGLYEKKRNPAYTEYDELGGNCNNFISQCLFAGGIPMDTTGVIDLQWKYYGPGIDAASAAVGRSMSWTGVEDFYEYCLYNTGFGLVCETDSNLFSGRPGDIIQYVSGDRGVHSVIITKVIYDGDGNVIDYLINSNTTDKVDCPMMTYGYTNVRLIRIVGWND